MKRFIAIAFALVLAGCVTNPITKFRVDALTASWGAALALGNGYYDACERRVIPQTCRTVVARLQGIAPTVQAKVTAAQNFAMRSSVSAVDLIAVAESAVNDFKAIQAQLGVR